MKSLKVRLIIMAHPDDAELSCGGTIAQWSKKDDVYYIVASSGEKGTWSEDESPFRVAEQREKESKQAANFLGVKKVIFLRHPDGEIENQSTLKIEIAALIRFLKPYTIVTHNPWRYHFHPDHRATGFAVIKSVMIARDFHFFPFLIEIGLSPHRAEELLFTPSDNPSFVNNISKTFEKKIQAIRYHKSQLGHLPDWEKKIREIAEIAGQNSGFQYGESFYRMNI